MDGAVCGFCGRVERRYARFCGRCGATLSQSRPLGPTPPGRRGRARRGPGLFITVLAAFVLLQLVCHAARVNRRRHFAPVEWSISRALPAQLSERRPDEVQGDLIIETATEIVQQRNATVRRRFRRSVTPD